MSLETFEAGYAGARPPRTGSQWSGMWKLPQTTDRLIDGKWPSPWSVTGGNQTKSFAIVPGELTSQDVQFNDDGTKFYIIGDTKDTIFQYTCATAWDVNTASYSDKSFYIGRQDGAPTGIFFKNDGTKFYIVGNGNDTIHQYSCATAWDISTSSYDTKSFSVILQESIPQGLFFKPDGTKFYVVGTVNDTVFQYSCATAWDISTASYDTKSFSVTAQESSPSGLFFKSDGTKFYIVGITNNTVYQYTCATAWDVSTASYDTKSFSVATQGTGTRGLFFKPDGTVFYIVGQVNNTVFQYSCATAWDVSTASYNGKAFYVGAGQESNPNDVQFNDDGTKFYIIGNSNDSIYQYSCATAWDVTTASFANKSFFIGLQETNAQGLFFKSDGTKFYIIGTTNDRVYQYSCATAWDISTGSYDTISFSVVSQEGNSQGLFFKPDGTKFYIVGTTNNTVFQYSCATAWDVSTASYDTKSFSVVSQDSITRGLFFKSDGTVFYTLGGNNRTIFQYTCATAWDVSTASYASKFFSVINQLTTDSLSGICFKSDGTQLYISTITFKLVYQYTCTTAWDMNIVSTYDSKSFSVNAQDTAPADVQFKSDGTKFYILGDTNNTIYQYSCATAWDVSTASYDTKSFGVGTQEATPTALFFKSDGTKFYIVGQINRTIYQYSCATAWDISTASYDSKSFSVNTQESNPQGLFFKPDGTKFYIVGQGTNTVYQYSCATAWDISTGSYDTKSLSVTIQETAPTALFFKSDGTKFYVVGLANKTVYQYSCLTAWDITVSFYDGRTSSVNAEEGLPYGLFFKSDGTKFYIVGQTNDTVYQYSCATAWEIQSPFYADKFFRLQTQETTPRGLFFKTDGTKFYIVGNTLKIIQQYSCATAWDVSTASYDNKLFNSGRQDINPHQVCFKPDGTKFYVMGGSNKTVYQYTCATAWDVSTASYDGIGFTVQTQENNPQAFFFKPDGTTFYVAGASFGTIYQYTCNTPWDVSTAYYGSKFFNINAQETNPQGLCFKDDGTKFYITGQTNDAIYQYLCTIPWDVSTASYDGVSYSILAQDTSSTEVQFKSDGTTFYMLGDGTDTLYQYSGLLQ